MLTFFFKFSFLFIEEVLSSKSITFYEGSEGVKPTNTSVLTGRQPQKKKKILCYSKQMLCLSPLPKQKTKKKKVTT